MAGNGLTEFFKDYFDFPGETPLDLRSQTKNRGAEPLILCDLNYNCLKDFMFG